MEPRDVTDDMHEEFFRFISNTFDKPRYQLHYKTDAPLNIRALFYVPEYKPSKQYSTLLQFYSIVKSIGCHCKLFCQAFC
jgi:HSP90 family molecular chaperone